jgi:hypothetical protein
MVKRDDEHERARKDHEIKLTEAEARGDHGGGGGCDAELHHVLNPWQHAPACQFLL